MLIDTHEDSLSLMETLRLWIIFFLFWLFRESLQLFSKHTNPHSSNDSLRKQKHKRTQEKKHHFAKFSNRFLLVKIFKVSIQQIFEIITDWLEKY